MLTWDDDVGFWDATTAVQFNTFSNHVKKITSVISYDSMNVFASSSLDKTFRLFDVRSFAEVARCKAHTAGVTCIRKESDFTIVSMSNDKTVKVF